MELRVLGLDALACVTGARPTLCGVEIGPTHFGLADTGHALMSVERSSRNPHRRVGPVQVGA